MARFTTAVKMLDAVTADTTSDPVDVSERRLMSLQLTCAEHGSGNGVFTVEVTNDEDPTTANWVVYNRLTTNATNTNAQTDIGVGSVTLNSNTSVIYFIRAGDHFRYMRAKVDVTTDGEYSAVLHAID